MQAIFDNILDRRLEWPDDPELQLSWECRDLIEKLLEPDPERRLGHRGAGEVDTASVVSLGDLERIRKSSMTFSILLQVKLHPFFQASPEAGRTGIHWKELVTQKAAFVPSSESKTLPSMYFEEKPVCNRSAFAKSDHCNAG